MEIKIDMNKLLGEIVEEKALEKTNNGYEDLLEMYEDKFSNVIKYRGETYYEEGSITNCYKTGANKFVGFVKGTQSKPYKVSIEINDEDEIEMKCSCPCDFPCKHEYAILKAIRNYEFSDIELKTEIKRTSDNLKNIVERIPAEEIKEYILSTEYGDYVAFEMEMFEKNFKKYLPKQTYDYYYNNLYNALVLEEYYEEKSDSYLNETKNYINGFEFKEAFKIISATINAFIDSNRIVDNDYIIEKMPVIGMYIRVINRKADDELKNKILKWFEYLEDNNYFNSLYLEDAVESSK